MIDISITKMSSRGQIVIPSEMRHNLKEGEKIAIIKNGDQLILKPVKKMQKNIQDDLEFAKRTEKAWQDYEQGKFTKMSKKDFLKELDRW